MRFPRLFGFLLWALFLGCSSSAPQPEGRFRLSELTGVESTSPQNFPAEDWASGFLLPEAPVLLDIQGSRVTVTGLSTATGIQSASRNGSEVSFSLVDDEDGIRLDLSFQGDYDPARDEIRGTLQQIWELTEETGNTRLAGQAVFSRVK